MKVQRLIFIAILFVLSIASVAIAGPGAVLDPPLYPNGRLTYYANSPAGNNYPIINPATGLVVAGSNSGTALRKFVTALPGLGLPNCTVSASPGTGTCNENTLGQYIPIANADTTTFSGSDYYVIGLSNHQEQMHTDLPGAGYGTGTKIRGYYQKNNGDALGGTTDHSKHYLGPLIVANKSKPVRIKFVNELGVNGAGDLFIPVDTTVMGAGTGPDGTHVYTQNRATVHLHGGFTPWISDGTPHQWITPNGEASTIYLKGLSQKNVPDMWYDASGNVISACAGLLTCGTAGATNNPGSGAATFYYTNEQSARLMFYHDHAYGLTRLNVYAGEAAGYLLTDQYEEDMISGTNVKGMNLGGAGLGKVVIPSLPLPYHWGIPLVIQDKTYVPQNVGGTAATYGQDILWNTTTWGVYGDLWFPHVYETAQDNAAPSGLNPAGRWDYGPLVWPPSPVTNDTLPQLSTVPEAFMDTPIVNGTAYPYLTVARKAYRFRILSAANDRSLNLQLYYAVDAATRLVKCNNNTVVGCTEVKMIAAPDGRDGGIPDPANVGPSMIQIGTEGGFLPAPVVLPNTPISFDGVGNVANKTLLLMPAERADVIIDFSNVPDGSTIILYNDAPAALPGGDPRYDYYTNNPDQTGSGGAPSTLPGYGPNIRTVMQFRVSGAQTLNATLLSDLQSALPVAFAASQPAPIVPEVAYGAGTNTYAKLMDTSMTVSGKVIPFKGKSINEGFDSTYGRINAMLGTQSPDGLSASVPLAYIDPVTETLKSGQTQLWKITHNGVDSHPIHFHLVNVQVINRVAWSGEILPPADNELGWKETVRMNPQEDIIVAMRPAVPPVPFAVPDSIRPLDVTMPADPVTNPSTNFGHEYVWHCHILGHEEFDLMRPMVLRPGVQIGVFRPSTGMWYLDSNGSGTWSGCGTDGCYGQFGMPGDLPVVGDWNYSGTAKIGVFRPSTGMWYLDLNGSGTWSGCGPDSCLGPFGMPGDYPVVGDWTGTGTIKIGVFRPSTGMWYLDLNGSGTWSGCGTDGCYGQFGMPGDLPVTGQW